jgi:hypothetical protein
MHTDAIISSIEKIGSVFSKEDNKSFFSTSKEEIKNAKNMFTKQEIRYC